MSVYASSREFVRTNHRPCALIVLDPLEAVEGNGLRAPVRRIEVSPDFMTKFGMPRDEIITPGNFLWPVIPKHRRMTAPLPLVLRDRNGRRHHSFAEAFDTTYNVLILLYPAQALTAAKVAVPTPAVAASF